MTNFTEPFFLDPQVLDVLRAAVDRAWGMIVAAGPTSASRPMTSSSLSLPD